MSRTALITGASGGIGYDLAEIMAADGLNLVIVARSADKLDKMAHEFGQKYGVTITAVAKDLARPQAPTELVAALEAANITIDLLVNNAGFATYGRFHELPLERELQMIQLNITTLTHLTHLLLPGMVQRGQGQIMNVASTAAFQPGPLMAVYYASKAFVLSFSEAIANELEGTGVTVTALCPGPTASGFQARAAMEESRLVQNGLMDSRTVAEIGYKGLKDGKTVVVPGLANKVGTMMPRFVPRKMVTRIVRNMQERTTH